MTTRAEDLDRAIANHLGEGAFAVEGGRGLFMEVNDRSTGLVWMSTSTVDRADFESLEVEKPLVKVGVGRAPMDRAVFRSSPGAPGEAVLRREIAGRSWINVAEPVKVTPPEIPGGPARVSVNKEHVIGFEAGREVSILRMPGADYVELVGGPARDDDLVLPEGGGIEVIRLEQPWVVPLPTPTDTWFWFGEDLRSFQGPVSLPD